MGIADYIILAVLAAAVIFAVRHMLRNKGGCSGGCAGCPRSGDCGAEKDAPEEKPPV